MRNISQTSLQWAPRDKSLVCYKDMIALRYTSPGLGTWVVVDVHKDTSEELKQAIVDTFLRAYDIIPAETAKVITNSLEKPILQQAIKPTRKAITRKKK